MMKNADNKLKIHYIEVDNLFPNPWNSNRMSEENEQRLEESLKRNDVFAPIIARRMNDGTFQIIGGEHRTRVAKKIGIKELPVVVLENISDNQAKEISLTHNARYGTDDNLKLSELLNSLDDASVISEIMPFDLIEIETLMSATKIDIDSLETIDDDDDELEDIEETKLSVKTHTIMRFKVSVEDASDIESLIKETCKTHGFDQSDALTNAGDALVHLLLNQE